MAISLDFRVVCHWPGCRMHRREREAIALRTDASETYLMTTTSNFCTPLYPLRSVYNATVLIINIFLVSQTIFTSCRGAVNEPPESKRRRVACAQLATSDANHFVYQVRRGTALEAALKVILSEVPLQYHHVLHLQYPRWIIHLQSSPYKRSVFLLPGSNDRSSLALQSTTNPPSILAR